MSTSLIQGKTWYWREGFKQMPIGNTLSVPVSELCLPMSDFIQGNRIKKELQEEGIIVDMKNTHSPSPYIPVDTFVLYAAVCQDKKDQQEEDNLKKLENYIIANDGKVGNNRPRSQQNVKGFWNRLFHGGK